MDLVLFIVHWSSGRIHALQTWVDLQDNRDSEASRNVQFIQFQIGRGRGLFQLN
jgi:hypothetical protein